MAQSTDFSLNRRPYLVVNVGGWVFYIPISKVVCKDTITITGDVEDGTVSLNIRNARNFVQKAKDCPWVRVDFLNFDMT